MASRNGRRPVRRAQGDRAEVAALAYTLYEQRGRADGRDLEDWLEAERQLREDEESARIAQAVAASQAALQGE
jgi:hypothetical protein